jgi:YVTN family beta-propeller protein
MEELKTGITTGYINSKQLAYQAKNVESSIRLGKNETPGRYGSALDSFKEGGLDITIDVLARSIPDRDQIVAAFMKEGMSTLKPGGVDIGWHYNGVCGDRSSQLKLSSDYPEKAYPLSFLFCTTDPFMYSDTTTSLCKSISATGQTWSTNDTYVCNLVTNDSFESWTTNPDKLDYPNDFYVGSGISWGIIKAYCSGQNCYVTGTSSGEVCFFNESGSLINTTAVTSSGMGIVRGMCANPAGTRIYATVIDDNVVAVINPTQSNLLKLVPVGTNPYGITTNANGSKLYVANNGSGTVSIIETTNHTVIATVAVGSSPIAVIRNLAGTKIYCINRGSSTISLIDTTTNAVTSTITLPVGSSPSGGVLASDGRLYVLNSGNGSYTIIGADGVTIGTSVIFGTADSRPYNALFSADGSKLYIFNLGSNNTGIVVIRTSDNTIIDNIRTSLCPVYGVFSYDGNKIIATSYNSYYVFSVPIGRSTPDTWITEL